MEERCVGASGAGCSWVWEIGKSTMDSSERLQSPQESGFEMVQGPLRGLLALQDCSGPRL